MQEYRNKHGHVCVIRNCEACGVEFLAPRFRIAKGFGRWCSRTCSAPNKGTLTSRPIAERFWSKVAISDGCWFWQGAMVSGYGNLGAVIGRRGDYAHRVAWTLATGETLTSDDVIGHTCDVRLCVRNDDTGIYVVRGVEYPRRGHLFKTTDAGNIRDAIDKGRMRFPPKPGHVLPIMA